MENLWSETRDKVAEKEPISAKDLIRLVKEVRVWSCQKNAANIFIHIMLRHLKDVIKNGGRHTKY